MLSSYEQLGGSLLWHKPQPQENLVYWKRRARTRTRGHGHGHTDSFDGQLWKRRAVMEKRTVMEKTGIKHLHTKTPEF